MITDDVVAAVFDSLPTPVAVLGPDGTVLRLSEAWRRSAATGFALLPVRPGMSWLAACDQAADAADRAAGQQADPGACAPTGSTHLLRADPVTPVRTLARLSRQIIDRRRTRARIELPQPTVGNHRWLDVRMSTFVRGAGVVVIVDDITERHEREAALQRRATTDAVTGLPNRAALHAWFAAASTATDNAESSGPAPGAESMVDTPSATGPAALFLDLDAFRRVNNSFDYSIGDATLRAAGKRFSSVLGPTDIIGRWDGDEFVVLTRSSTAAAVANLAERLDAALAEPLDVHGHRIHLSVSIGVALAHVTPPPAPPISPGAGRKLSISPAQGTPHPPTEDWDVLVARAGREVIRTRSQHRTGQARRSRSTP
ncbi:GGDEF domain-containing protein [Frankia sp. AgB32]|uniref:diguanylate cyclase domain-containing protein n=1 Tax=Frankia sp. AgB32 TaxID=631119 RepID=UPI00200DD6AF|nr:GGDEF domain-containing protein [Frankia sp. AgB32]MCK9897675.1 GGDEF domain-containing protein [Frankia sp. AgB32]